MCTLNPPCPGPIPTTIPTQAPSQEPPSGIVSPPPAPSPPSVVSIHLTRNTRALSFTFFSWGRQTSQVQAGPETERLVTLRRRPLSTAGAGGKPGETRGRLYTYPWGVLSRDHKLVKATHSGVVDQRALGPSTPGVVGANVDRWRVPQGFTVVIGLSNKTAGPLLAIASQRLPVHLVAGAPGAVCG